MKVKFNNGEIFECNTPTETKLFRSGEPYGWLLRFSLIGDITSSQLDDLLEMDNISMLVFTPSVILSEGDTVIDKNDIALSGYEKVSSVVINYGDTSSTRADIQLTKRASDNG